MIFGYLSVKSLTSFLMSGTQVQNVNVVSVSIALSMSDWGTAEAEDCAGGASSPPPPQAASSHALEVAAAVVSRNLRRVNGAEDIAVLP